MGKYTLVDNEERCQYEIHVDGYTSKIEYFKEGNEIYLAHTEVPYMLEGQGIGSALVRGALENIEKNGLHLIPLCPFVSDYIQRHPEWSRIVRINQNKLT